MDATHDKVSLTLKGALANNYAQGTHVSQLQWITYAVDTNNAVLTRDAHDTDSNGNAIGPQIVASNSRDSMSLPMPPIRD